MKVSIVTINYNNVEGLKKTLSSVFEQSYRDIEHIIIDGGSTDGSVDAIKEYVAANPSNDPFFKHTINWVSEKDSGIYNAMNKGIRKANGAYVQILNSGDIFANLDVVERIVAEIEKVEYPELFYGNMIKKDYATGKILGKSKEVEYSLRQYYTSTMNHDCCYIRRDVYDKYGLYDESLKIVSDWKWFLMYCLLLCWRTMRNTPSRWKSITALRNIISGAWHGSWSGFSLNWRNGIYCDEAKIFNHSTALQ